MTQNEVFLELSPGLEASGAARAAVTESFGDLGEDRLVDLRLAVASLVTNSIRAHGKGPIQVHLWRNGGSAVRGEVKDDGSGAESLRSGSPDDPIRTKVLDAVTREWGVAQEAAWFVV
jgi:anti-sigma regulatory factor (Ser/Thr protein kinase)